MNKKLFSFRLDEALMENAREQAQSEAISVTKLVTLAIQEYIKKQAPENESSGEARAKGAENASTIQSAVSKNNVNLVRDLLVELLLEHRDLSEFKSQSNQLSQMKEEMEDRLKSIDKKMESMESILTKNACSGISNHTQCNT